jgi:hypothetical protein
MPSRPNAAELLDRQFLETRAKILQVAAELDRLDRAEGAVDADPRMEQMARALDCLQGDQTNRAEQVQMIFSRGYDSNWKQQFGLSAPSPK